MNPYDPTAETPFLPFGEANPNSWWDVVPLIGNSVDWYGPKQYSPPIKSLLDFLIRCPSAHATLETVRERLEDIHDFLRSLATELSSNLSVHSDNAIAMLEASQKIGNLLCGGYSTDHAPIKLLDEPLTVLDSEPTNECA